MSCTRELVQTIEAQGVALRVVSGELQAKNKHRLPDYLLEALHEDKDAVIQYLAERERRQETQQQADPTEDQTFYPEKLQPDGWIGGGWWTGPYEY